MNGRPRPDAVCDPDPRRLEARFVERLRDELAAARARSPAGLSDLVVVAPTRRLLDRIEERATKELRALAGVEFVTHHGLARRALRDGATPLPQALPAAWLAPLVAPRLLAATTPLQRYLQAQPSALGPLLATFRDLRDAGVGADAARATAPRLGATAQATIALFAVYDEAIGAIERTGLGDSASAAHAATAAAPLRAQALLHYGAYELIGSHRALVARAATATPTTFFVPTRADALPTVALLDALGSAPMRDAPVAPPSAAAVERTSAATPRDELRVAVRQLLAWRQRDGIPFDELAILLRSPGPYGDALHAEAALLDAAFDVSFETPLDQSSTGGRLALALRHLLDPADRLIARVARRRWPAEWPSIEALARAIDGAATLPARLATVRALAGDDATVGALLDGAIVAAQRLTDAALLPAALASREAACDLALALLAEAPERRAGREPGALRVIELHQARALPLRRAVLVGANERLLPRETGDDFFLPDGDRRRLSEATGAPLALAADAARDEELLVATALAGVADQLVVSWSRSDGEREVAPSPWIDRLAPPTAPSRALSRHPVAQLVELRERTGLLTPAEALLLALPRAAAEREPPHFASAPWLARAWARTVATESYAPRDGRFDGDVGPLAQPDHYTPSAIEQLGRCPLQYFFAKVLRVRAPDEQPASGELPASLRGSLFHRLLHELYRDRFRRGRPSAPADAAAFVAELGREIAPRLDALLDQPPFAGALHGQLRRLRVARWSEELARFAARDLARLAALGIASGDFETALAGALRVGADQRPLRFELRFDRVLADCDGGEWIGDYKSSARLDRKASLTAAVRGRELQLPLYGLARLEHLAQERDGGKKARTLRGLELYSLRPQDDAAAGQADDETWRQELDVGELMAAKGELAATLGTLHALHLRGLFPLVPESDDHGQCGRCDFRLACRHSHGATRARAEADLELAEFHALAAKKAP